jgi:hypothetical protein
MLYSVSWNCNDDTVRVITSDGSHDVVFFGKTQGRINAVSDDTQNLPGRTVFTANYYDDVMFLRVYSVDGRFISSISESIRPDSCVGEKIFNEYAAPSGTAIPDDAPEPGTPEPGRCARARYTRARRCARARYTRARREPGAPEPGAPEKSAPVKSELAPFVDLSEDPYSYVKRYVEEPSYKEWFDGSYPQYDSICDAVGLGAGCISEYGRQASEDADPRPAADPGPGDDVGGGCLVATAAFGSELAPQVQQLREVRDGKLMQTAYGSMFMGAFNSVYYSFSPGIADLQREHPLFREAVKLYITPMLSTLGMMSYADDDATVLGLGLSVIALNLGMYVAAPAYAASRAWRHYCRCLQVPLTVRTPAARWCWNARQGLEALQDICKMLVKYLFEVGMSAKSRRHCRIFVKCLSSICLKLECPPRVGGIAG